MRVHIVIEDSVVARIDRLAGERGRSGWIVQTIQERLDFDERWDAIESAFGSIPDTGHEWDDDPAAWVREVRSEPWREFDGADPS